MLPIAAVTARQVLDSDEEQELLSDGQPRTEGSSDSSGDKTAKSNRSAKKRGRKRLSVCETMPVSPSSALQIIINNPGKLESFYDVDQAGPPKVARQVRLTYRTDIQLRKPLMVQHGRVGKFMNAHLHVGVASMPASSKPRLWSAAAQHFVAEKPPLHAIRRGHGASLCRRRPGFAARCSGRRGSLYCFSCVTPNTYEVGMVAAMAKLEVGMFECDDFDVISNTTADELFKDFPDDKVHVVHHHLYAKMVKGPIGHDTSSPATDPNSPLYQGENATLIGKAAPSDLSTLVKDRPSQDHAPPCQCPHLQARRALGFPFPVSSYTEESAQVWETIFRIGNFESRQKTTGRHVAHMTEL
eukprot:s1442_g14.t1